MINASTLGGTPIWKGQGCSLEILNLPPKRDQSGRGRSLCRPLKETVYANRVNIRNQNSLFFVMFSRATLNKILTAKNNAQNILGETKIRNLHP